LSPSPLSYLICLVTTLASSNIGRSVDARRADSSADLRRLSARIVTFELSTDRIGIGDARIGDRSGVAVVSIDADQSS